MSYKLVNQVKRMRGLTLAEKSVLFRLADESRNEETVKMKCELIASDAGCSERTVSRCLNLLEKKGVIIPIGKTAGRGHVTVYRICLDVEIPQIIESTIEPPKAERIQQPPRIAPAPPPVPAAPRPREPREPQPQPVASPTVDEWHWQEQERMAMEQGREDRAAIAREKKEKARQRALQAFGIA